MNKEYYVHIHSTTSYVVKADSEEQAKEIATEEFDSIDFDSDNYVNHEDNKTEISQVEDYE